jgi:hypothetical protein
VYLCKTDVMSQSLPLNNIILGSKPRSGTNVMNINFNDLAHFVGKWPFLKHNDMINFVVK